MKTLWLSIALILLAGCAATDPTAFRADPQAFSNPELLRCAAARVPVCEVWGGRTGKHYLNCRCRGTDSETT